jgi:hypothetical protein
MHTAPRFADTTDLWSKRLPSGELFDLSDATRGVYLHHRSGLGEFFLSSDSAIPTFTRWASMKPITEQFPQPENDAFMAIAYTIGGMMVFREARSSANRP